MKDKQLTPLQKTRATQREVKKYIKEVLEPKMIKDIETSFKSNWINECYLESDNTVKEFIINKYVKK